MTLEEDLSRQLHGRAAGLRSAPNLGDLSVRIRIGERKTQRHERLALGAAVVVLAGSIGGLAGALVHQPRVSLGGQQAGYVPTVPTTSPQGSHTPTGGGGAVPSRSTPPKTLISSTLGNGFNATVTRQPLSAPVAVSVDNGRPVCVAASVLTTTIGQAGLFAGATAVTGLPTLSPIGLEILSSGVLQGAGGAQVWWTTVAVGSGVARVAAENVGGQAVAAAPTDGVAVMAGVISGSSAGSGEMSAVAEASDGSTLDSMGFQLGAGPSVFSAADTPVVAGCAFAPLPPQVASASSSQPANPQLAAASVVAAFEQAYSADALLGFSANLASVDQGATLSTSSAKSPAGVLPGSSAPTSTTAAPGGSGPVVGAAVGLRQVTFVSDSQAAVIYTVGNGVSFTGQAVLGSDGIWRVSLDTFCGGLRAGAVQGDVPAAVGSACESAG